MRLKIIQSASRLLAIACLSGTAATAMADPAVQLGVGRDVGNDIEKAEINMAWDTGLRWGNPDGWQLNLDVELALAQWRTTGGTNRRNLTEGGVSPMFRIEYRAWEIVPYIEAGIGVRVLSHTQVSDEHRFSSAFQFADTIGVGVSMGDRQQFSMGYRYQHISNASIKRPNPGSNFSQIYVRYRF